MPDEIIYMWGCGTLFFMVLCASWYNGFKIFGPNRQTQECLVWNGENKQWRISPFM